MSQNLQQGTKDWDPTLNLVSQNDPRTVVQMGLMAAERLPLLETVGSENLAAPERLVYWGHLREIG